jgi:chemotaxis protein methyltransferase CheR
VSESAGVLQLLSRAAGLDLAAYREEHVAERIRMAIEREGALDAEHLAQLLRSDSAARARLRRSVAVTVSGPFRDPEQYELLERELLPPLLEGTRRIPVWSAGCADGSELLSVGLILDRLGALGRSILLGSDLLEENIAVARRGLLGGHPVREEIRARTHWERRDLLRDGPPGGRWRLVLCRNLAIYLGPRAKRALHKLLAASLAHDGILLLGRAERLLDAGALGLEAVAPNAYRRLT